MLSSSHRLRSGGDIRATTRRGRRAGSRTVLAHARLGVRGPDAPTRVAFVAGKQVGNAVTRNQVKRRLRAQMGPRLALVPGGSDLVLRALPASSTSTSTVLASDLDRVLGRLATSASSRSAR